MICAASTSCDQNNTATDNVYGIPAIAFDFSGTPSGWTLGTATTANITAETTGGTLGTGSYSLTVSNPGSAGLPGTGTGTGTSSGSSFPAGDTVTFTSSNGVTGTATYASSVSDFATVTNGLINVSLPFIASASATGSGAIPANVGDPLAVWNSGSAPSPVYTYVDLTSQSSVTNNTEGTVGFSFTDPGGTTSVCSQSFCGPTNYESPFAYVTAEGWSSNIQVPSENFTIDSTGGTLGTGSFSETVDTAGSTGSTGGSGPSSGPPSISVTTQSGQVGHPLTLHVLGALEGTTVTYSVSNGTASGCRISANTLVAATAGTCMVVATEIAPGNVTVTTSSSTAISFALPAKPGAITAGFTANASALSIAAKRSLIALSKKLSAGASVVVTGFARANIALARQRAIAAANFLRSHVHVTVRIATITKLSVNKVTVTTLKQ